MSRILRTAAAVLLLMAVAQGPAGEHVWSNFISLGDNGTSPNQGRMIEWCPPPWWSQAQVPWVEATWVSNSNAMFSHSTDNGLTWDDPGVMIPSNHPFGTFRPALRTGPDASAWVCKRASDEVPRWLECTVAASPPNPWTLSNVDWGGSRKYPVATALSTTSGAPMVYMVTTYWAEGDGQARLVFWAFDNTVPWATVYHTMPLATCNSDFDFQASIDYTPGDKVHVVYRDPDGAVQYFTWASALTPAQIRAHVPPIWSGPYRVSQLNTTQEPGSHPFVDADGENVFCVWRGVNENHQNIGEIYKAQHNLLWPPQQWLGWQVTFSTGLESDYPQCYTSTTVTWQEEMPAGNTEIFGQVPGMTECISNAPGYMNWWPQASVKNPVPPYDPWVIHCHTLWSQEKITNGAQSIHYKLYDFIPHDDAGLEYPTYLRPTLGQPKASSYCLGRDGYVDYGNSQVDFGKSGLAYDLPYLDPARDYLAQFTLFNGESLPITQSIKLGGFAVAEKTLRPGICETLFAYIPRAAYKGTHARLEVTRLSGPFACLAKDVRIYETYRVQERDGALAQTGPAAPGRPCAQPNPFNSRTMITLDGASPGSLLRVYDASGRLVRSLRAEGRPGLGCAAVWDGAGSDGRALPAGVYTCSYATGSTASSVKVIRQ